MCIRDSVSSSVNVHLMVGIDSVEVALSMPGDIINSRFHHGLFVRVCACVSVDSEKLRDLWSRHSGLAASSECLSGLLGLLLGSAASRWDVMLALVDSVIDSHVLV